MTDKDEFIEFKTMTVIETTHGSLNLHIPAAGVRRADIKPGTMMKCFINPITKEIRYVPLKTKQNQKDKKSD